MRIAVALTAGILALGTSAFAQEAPPANPTPVPATLPAAQNPSAAAHITLDDALRLALQHHHALLALRSTILQNQAQEITANLRPNPTLAWDAQFLPIFQPDIDADRQKIARYGINVSDVEAVIQAAVGGQTATQVIQGEKLFDMVVRMEPQFRSNARDIDNLLVPAPAGQQIPLSELATIREASGASFIYRENNSRYIGIQFSVEGRNLEGIVKQGQQNIAKNVSLPEGHRME